MPRDMYGLMDTLRGPAAMGTTWDHTHNARALSNPSMSTGPEASTSFYPGYQWWPSQLMTTEGPGSTAMTAPMEVPPVSAPMPYSSLSGFAHPQEHRPQPSPTQEPFQYDAEQMPQDYGMQGVNYPSYDFSRYQHHDTRRPDAR